MGSFDPMGVWAAQERVLTPPFIVSMSPPGYPSAWLRPRSARFRFARQDHCSSATTCRFSTSGLSVIGERSNDVLGMWIQRNMRLVSAPSPH